MKSEIVSPKKEQSFEPITIQLTFETPEEAVAFTVFYQGMNKAKLDDLLGGCFPSRIRVAEKSINPHFFKESCLAVEKELKKQGVSF